MQLLHDSPADTLPRTLQKQKSLSAEHISRFAALLPIGLLWTSLFFVLATDWSINSQYSYGWIVPFLTIAVIVNRWSRRPASAPRSSPILFSIVAALLLVAALPMRLLEEANPEWRLILWAHALLAAGATLLWFGFSGGSPWVRHFLFPTLFPLISVPLPMLLEANLIQNLTRVVSAATTELALLIDIPAVQHGNLIEVSTGILGVEEACSGIRSLQSSILVALFLGEHYNLTPLRRMIAALIAFAIAIMSNIGRTLFLVLVAARENVAAADRFHDSAAMVGLVVALGALFVVIRLLRSAPCEPVSVGSTCPFRSMSRAVALGATCWLFLVWSGVELWYRAHELDPDKGIRWSVLQPAGQFKAIEIPERSRSILRYSSGHSMSWRDSGGHAWRLYYLRWEPGRNSAQLAKAHAPEICLSGAGGKLQEVSQDFNVSVGSLELRFSQLAFDFHGKTLFVFYHLSEDHPRSPSAAAEDGSQRSRILAALQGRRHLGQSVLEVAVQGPSSAAEACAAFEREISRLIRF